MFSIWEVVGVALARVWVRVLAVEMGEEMSVRIINGDCLDELKKLAAGSVDSCVTDPPYGLKFMGKTWDHGIPGVPYWTEVLRVLKPGGYCLAFGGTRTYHRMACAIEDAGFEIRDMVSWLYGQGFPKGTDKAKIPAAWKGWNTALKPALEPICFARKPMEGTLAQNLEKWGTGAIWIDGCRIDVVDDAYENNFSGDRGHEGTRKLDGTGSTNMRMGGGKRPLREVAPMRDGVEYVGNALAGRVDGSLQSSKAVGETSLGRWPTNVLLDGSEEVLSCFPESNGQMGAVGPQHGERPSINKYGDWGARPDCQPRGDSGSAARFFYCSKASRADRNEGLHGMGTKPLNWSSGEQSPGTFQSPNTNRQAQNHHPTVKPTELMRYLCRLVTPKGGTVLDPFMGSGSTLKAAELEGFSAIGIEIDAEYCEIARRRIAADAPLFAEVA